ncbi:MAG: PEP-CTERM sorting domain-containing protein [Pirellulales bacterium]|nr:PEP-CTERM sorting domain-containing protein [Pirellulales bacterium]
MRHLTTFAVIVALLAFASLGYAEITSWECEPDGDPALDCDVTWTPELDGSYTMEMDGVHHSYPAGNDVAHMVGSFTTDTELDPTIWVISGIDNDTSFPWTAYQVNVYMSSPFALSNETVYSPPNWDADITVTPASAPSGCGYDYMGTIMYSVGTGGSPIPVGGTLTFGYKMSFDGSLNYGYCQEMIPIPEPAALTLLLSGLMLGGFIWLRRR